MKRKICTKCHKNKFVSFFRKDKTKPDGLYSSCVTCYRNKYNQEPKIKKEIVKNGVTLRWCSYCKRRKTRDCFYTNTTRKDGVHNECKECSKKRATSEESLLRNRGRHQRERLRVLRFYGGDIPECKCCRENRNEFLCIDHIDGCGKEHRKRVDHVYRWIIKNSFPKGFRVLCHNCNMSLGFYGYCPHKNI